MNKLLSKFLIIFGTMFVGIGLELFLVPNKIIDGGIIGIAIIFNYLTKYSLGAFIIALNIPFLLFGLKKLGKKFILNSFFAIMCLAAVVSVIHYFKVTYDITSATKDLLLATIFGGIITGIGVGTIIKNNGSLDGTEILAVAFSKKMGFSVGEIVMFINIFILSSSGFVFGWDRAMYSMATYFIIFKSIDLILEGFDETKTVMIISDKYDEISAAIINDLDKGVTFIEAQGAYTKEPKKIIYCVINRLELSQLRELVSDIDQSAFITIENVHEVQGGRTRKNNFKFIR